MAGSEQENWAQILSWGLPGNTVDVRTVAVVLVGIKCRNTGWAMFVACSDMNSEDKPTELAKACGQHLLAFRMASVSEVKREVLSLCGGDKSNHIKDVKATDRYRWL